MSETQERERCWHCEFFLETPVPGLCRRFPRHSETAPDDWCGEFKPCVAEVLGDPLDRQIANFVLEKDNDVTVSSMGAAQNEQTLAKVRQEIVECEKVGTVLAAIDAVRRIRDLLGVA